MLMTSNYISSKHTRANSMHFLTCQFDLQSILMIRTHVLSRKADAYVRVLCYRKRDGKVSETDVRPHR